MDKWYKNNYRRHLLDMHIEDWNDAFLSEFDPNEYFENLKRARMQCAMIYLQSHVGLCNFPTKVGREHRAFKGNDKMKNLIGKCRDNGIAVVGYYSLIHNNRAEEDHPEWKITEKNGKSPRENGGRYGFVCPNNAEYRKFLEEQIREMSEFTELDGMFYDMPFWPAICKCEACRKRWDKEVGGDLPDETVRDEKWELYVKKLQEWMAEFCGFVKDKTKECMPNVTIEFNNAGIVAFDWSAGSTEKISDLADYAGGDLYGDAASHSFARKYFYAITQNQPFEYMNSRCIRLTDHTVTKDRELLETEINLTRAHHGAMFIIDAIDPVGTMDRRVYELLGDIFKKEERLEKYNKGRLVADVAVYYDSSTQFLKDGYQFGNKDSSVAAVRRFTERHIPVGVIANGHMGDLSSYKCILATGVENFGNPEIEKLIDYVYEGGTLYFDGVSDNRLIDRLLGGDVYGTTHGKMTYIAPEKEYENQFCGFTVKYPAPFRYAMPKVKIAKDAEILARICLPYTDPDDNLKFASIHSNPSGIITDDPAVVYRKVGKGNVIWCAAAMELDDRKPFGDTLVSLLKYAGVDDFTVSAKCSQNIETVSFKDDETFYVGAVSMTCDRECRYPIKISVKTDKKPASVTELCEDKNVPFVYENGRIIFEDELVSEKTYEIK